MKPDARTFGFVTIILVILKLTIAKNCPWWFVFFPLYIALLLHLLDLWANRK